MLRRSRIEQLSDEALVQLLSSKKSDEALTELHARYSKKVLGYFIRMFHGDVDKAHDFVQELFMRILDKHHQFDINRKFYTWMFTIASNMCKIEFRSSRRMSFISNEQDLEKGEAWMENLTDKKHFQKIMALALSRLEV